MTDIVERLRAVWLDDNDAATQLLCFEAATEIERLSREAVGASQKFQEAMDEIERLRKQIKDLDAMHDELMVRHD